MADDQPAKPEAKPAGGNNMPWNAMRDVTIYSMDRGLLLPTMVGLAILVILVKYPDADLPALTHRILSAFRKIAGISYVLNVLLLIGWNFSSTRYRKRLNGKLAQLDSKT
jgi:hypothetical protein